MELLDIIVISISINNYVRNKYDVSKRNKYNYFLNVFLYNTEPFSSNPY